MMRVLKLPGEEEEIAICNSKSKVKSQNWSPYFGEAVLILRLSFSISFSAKSNDKSSLANIPYYFKGTKVAPRREYKYILPQNAEARGIHLCVAAVIVLISGDAEGHPRPIQDLVKDNRDIRDENVPSSIFCLKQD